MKKVMFLLAFIAMNAITVTAKDGYSFKVRYTDARDSLVYLCHYFGKSTTVFRDDSAKLSPRGEAQFSSDKKIVGGVYMLLFADKSASCEVMLQNGDNFSFELSKTDPYNTAKFVGKTDNIPFYEYQRFLTTYGREYQKMESELIGAKTKADTNVVYDKLRAKGKELTKYRNETAAKYPTSFLKKLFDAVDEPEIPTELPTLPDGKKDSSYPRIFYKTHYWDKYDFRDDRLIYTPLYERKLDDYLTKLVVPVPDSVEDEADKLLAKCKGTEETFKYTLWYLTRWAETSKVMGMDEAFVYLVENYYMKGVATWIDSAQLKKYIDRARDIAPNMIGQPAMDLRMIDTTGKNVVPLSSVKANYTILIFWSPDCGHCKKEIPQFDSLYKAVLKKYNVKMYAVDADNETDKWKTFIKENKLNEGWIHVHDPLRNTNFRSFYDVYSTPTIYLLDDKKVIRGKRIDHNNLVGLVEWLEKKKKDDTAGKK